MTDERVETPRLLRAALRLPRGSGIVLRHHATPMAERGRLFEALRAIARRRGHVLLLAGPVAQARAWRADGCHGRRGRAPGMLMSVPVHDMRELNQAMRLGADLIFLSPLFATRSHPGARPLGPARFAAIARRAPMPVLALGGVGRRHGALIRRLGAHGYGAIDSLTR